MQLTKFSMVLLATLRQYIKKKIQYGELSQVKEIKINSQYPQI